jgi:DNA-binding Lrp family transcriptional regulator
MSAQHVRHARSAGHPPVEEAKATSASGAVSLDQRIAVALQLKGRATWRDIAVLVGTSESTVARRARALMAAGVIRTTAVADPLRCGFGHPVLVRFGCVPDRSLEVARRLAARPDVRFLALVTGQSNIVAELIVGSSDHLARVLIEEVPSIAGVMRTTTESVLRNFKTAFDWSRPLLEGLVEVPAPPLIDVRAPQAPLALDAIDIGLIDQLRKDGRRGYQDLGSALGISESAARRRVDNLIAGGCVYPATLVDPGFLGFDVEVFVSMRVNLARLEEVAAALVGRPEVRYLSATSGYSDLVAEVILRSQDDLYHFRTQVLGALAGIREVDVALELQTVKRAYLRMDERGPERPSHHSRSPEPGAQG